MEASFKSESLCSNHDVGFTCTCNTGFQLDQLVNQCLSVDECNTDNLCDELLCTNLPGSYHCGCESGYTPDNENVCININECKIGSDDCDFNAVCENNEGSFSCECRGPLVYGSGKDCYYVNPCLMNPCDDFSTCTMDE